MKYYGSIFRVDIKRLSKAEGSKKEKKTKNKFQKNSPVWRKSVYTNNFTAAEQAAAAAEKDRESWSLLFVPCVTLEDSDDDDDDDDPCPTKLLASHETWTVNIQVSVEKISNSQTPSSKYWTENGRILVWTFKF